jgi:hypothetical protein
MRRKANISDLAHYLKIISASIGRWQLRFVVPIILLLGVGIYLATNWHIVNDIYSKYQANKQQKIYEEKQKIIDDQQKEFQNKLSQARANCSVSTGLNQGILDKIESCTKYDALSASLYLLIPKNSRVHLLEIITTPYISRFVNKSHFVGGVTSKLESSPDTNTLLFTSHNVKDIDWEHVGGEGEYMSSCLGDEPPMPGPEIPKCTSHLMRECEDTRNKQAARELAVKRRSLYEEYVKPLTEEEMGVVEKYISCMWDKVPELTTP